MTWHYIPELPTECGFYQVITHDSGEHIREFTNDFQCSEEWLREVIAWAEM